MVDSTFDADAFLDAQVDTPFETIRTTIPAGDKYIGTIESVKYVVTREGKIHLDVRWEIMDDELKAKLNFEKLFVTQTHWPDFDEVTGRLKNGVNNNVSIGQLREVLGQNVPGQPWSPRMFEGKGPCRLRVVEDPDTRNPLIKFNRIVAVSKLTA